MKGPLSSRMPIFKFDVPAGLVKKKAIKQVWVWSSQSHNTQIVSRRSLLSKYFVRFYGTGVNVILFTTIRKVVNTVRIF